jgi:hypothetical protein
MAMDIKLGEGRVYGARYYTAMPDFGWGSGWYNQHWNDMENWCVETFGDPPKDGVWTPSARWYVNNSMFWFRNIEDRNWFILRFE